MYFGMPYYNPYDFYRVSPPRKSYKTLQEALVLVRNAVQGEREDELFYDYLISAAPTQEEKDIITTIRDDERKHNRYFREIYRFYTGQNVTSPANVNFERPKSYIDGIKRAKFGELGAVERYRDIRAGLPDEYYRDMVFEILTDELKHAHKYDYILYLSLAKAPARLEEQAEVDSSALRSCYREEKEFTLSELAEYDGTNGKPAYVAVKGVVYDVSNNPYWSTAKHYGLTAGKDLSSLYESSHGAEGILETLPKVGILKE
ncbi:MAG: cytochrome b5 domain-containing protein [Bacillota bacterium]|nr:cytochrome b5 domain-containing protein [Bacillota bacterium]